MSVPQFQDLVDRYGANPADWPAVKRSLALALLKTSLKARQVLTESEKLATAGEQLTPKAPSQLIDRILGKALREQPKPHVGLAGSYRAGSRSPKK